MRHTQARLARAESERDLLRQQLSSAGAADEQPQQPASPAAAAAAPAAPAQQAAGPELRPAKQQPQQAAGPANEGSSPQPVVASGQAKPAQQAQRVDEAAATSVPMFDVGEQLLLDLEAQLASVAGWDLVSDLNSLPPPQPAAAAAPPAAERLLPARARAANPLAEPPMEQQPTTGGAARAGAEPAGPQPGAAAPDNVKAVPLPLPLQLHSSVVPAPDLKAATQQSTQVRGGGHAR